MINKFLLSILISFSSLQLFSQNLYTDVLNENSVYANAPESVKNSKAFMRQWWFFDQRAFPFGYIPEGVYENAMQQRDALRNENMNGPTVNWVSLGPTPGGYFNYGNISSRIVTGAFDPSDPNIIYVGPANGGVWKTTDGGINWFPLTDNQESLAMGAIAIDPTNPNIIYAGTGEATYSGASYYGRGLLKSTDGGNSWQRITNGLPGSTYFARLKIRPNHPNELLAALGWNGIFRSTDSGLSWSVVSGNRCDEVVFTFTGDTAFAIVSGFGLMRSLDGGATFVSFGTGLGSFNRSHFDLCLSSPNIMFAANYLGSTVNVYKSTNYGANWTQLAMSSDFQNQGGQAWYDLYLRINPKNPNKVYIGTIDVYRSLDGTNFTNITNGYSGGSVHVDQHYLFFHPTVENTFFVCNDGGIWKTTNNGDSFTNMNQTLTLTQFYRIKASPFDAGRILGGTQDNGTQQTFSTLNWNAAYGGDGGEVAFNYFDNNYIIGETQNGGLFRTSNGGNSWISAMGGITTSENVTWVAPIISHPTVSGVFYVARQRVYKTTNNGGLWSPISGNVNGTNAVREMTISESSPDIMYATTGASVFLSTDAGATWTNKTSGLPGRTITSVYIHPTDPNIAFITFSGFGTNKVYKTTNRGNNWVSINGNLPDSPVNDFYYYRYDPVNPNTYFVATDIGVFLTQNDGADWTELTDGLPNTVILHLDYSPSNQMMRAGTHGRGVYEAFIDFTVPVELESFTSTFENNLVILNWLTATETNNLGFEIERKLKNQEWRRIGFVDGNGTTTERNQYSFSDDLSAMPYEGKILYRLKQIDFNGSYQYSHDIAIDVKLIPDKITLSQNYPNPFNPSTTIEFTLPTESNVKLSIFNSIGEVVDRLVSERKNAGRYEVVWNAQKFSSGIYFYLLEVDKFDGSAPIREIRKLVYVR